MICERVPSVRIGQYGKLITGFVTIGTTRVDITRTECHLGGSRAWFLCPDCKRRCGTLYLVSCRICMGLHYASEHKSPLDRLLLKAIRHRARHGQSVGGVVVPFPSKPKRMRWHTYFRARKTAEYCEMQIIAGFRSQLRMLKQR